MDGMMTSRQLAASENFTPAQKIRSALCNWDTKQSTRKHYNRNALGIYMRALGELESDLSNGVPLRRAILTHFCGKLGDVCLRSCGLPLATRDELRGIID